MTPPPVRIAVMTIPDTRTLAEDTSGQALVELAEADGHQIVERLLVKEDIYRIRFEVSRWIIEPGIDVGFFGGLGQKPLPQEQHRLIRRADLHGQSPHSGSPSQPSVGRAVAERRLRWLTLT